MCGITSKLSSYFIHSKRFTTTKPTSQFWQIQAAIVKELRLVRSLSLVVAFVHPNHNSRAVSHQFITWIKSDGWLVFDCQVSFTEFGNSVVDSCRLIIAVHSHTEEKCSSLQIITPPSIPPNRLSSYQWPPFNWPKSTASYSRDDASFNNHAVNDSGLPPLVASDPPNSCDIASGNGSIVKYCLHRPDSDPCIKLRSYVVGTDSLCPRFEPCDNSNLF